MLSRKYGNDECLGESHLPQTNFYINRLLPSQVVYRTCQCYLRQLPVQLSKGSSPYESLHLCFVYPVDLSMLSKILIIHEYMAIRMVTMLNLEWLLQSHNRFKYLE